MSTDDILVPYIATEEIVETTYQAMQHAGEVIIVCNSNSSNK